MNRGSLFFLAAENAESTASSEGKAILATENAENTNDMNGKNVNLANAGGLSPAPSVSDGQSASISSVLSAANDVF